jgi:class 3 adenylate cyclase
VADAHRAIIVDADEPPAAYGVMSHLLDTIVGAIGPTFRLAKLEGDAVFAVAGDPVPHGPAFVDEVRSWYRAFEDGLAMARETWACTCEACIRIGDLDLKFIVHQGTWIAQTIVGQEELLGPDVNVAHRLLKNHARELVGTRAYALFSVAAVDALEIPPAGLVATTERYDDPLVVEARVLALA